MSGGGKASSRNQRSAEADRVRSGEVLAGKFRVERVVGRGGMGVVIEATNLQLDQKVALKLLARGGEDPAVVERFSREARAAAGLRSEHVARVYDVGKDTLHGPFIVMEMLEGKTLADVVASGRVAPHRAVEYVIDACEGLAEAHARGIVHQDVKPGNLFLVTGADGRPSIKLLDFGIATMRSKERERDTKSSHPSQGTPAYLAPEQLRSAQQVDHRADVWALGCVLYELLVGERPFRAARFTELVTRILEEAPDPLPPDLDLPGGLGAVLERCLQKEPAKRFASTGALALALLPFARRRAHSAVTRAVAHVKNGGLDPDLVVPETMPPPPLESGDLPSSPDLRAPSLPSIPDLKPAAGTSTNTALGGSITPNAARRSQAPLYASIAVLLVAGGAILWMRGGGHTDVDPNAGRPAPPALPPPAPSVTTPAPASSPSASAAPVASEAPAAPSATVSAPVRIARPPPPRAHTTASASDSDIRLSR